MSVEEGGAALPLVVLAAGRATRYGGIKPLAPVGVAGEAVIDVLASDALDAGFERIVLVVGPETAPAIRYHVSRTWPGSAHVSFALQKSPRGTVDAVLAAAPELGTGVPFGVANADDLPGQGALSALASHLRGDGDVHVAVCFTLKSSLLGDAPVTRGICTVGDDGLLRRVDERRQVALVPGGGAVAHDGREPPELDPDATVSMNLWGFRPDVLELFRAAMVRAEAGGAGGREVLLPELVDDVLAGRAPGPDGGLAIRVVVAPGRCIGVTHQGDVGPVHAELARQVGRGERPAQLWVGAVAPLG